MTPSTSNHSHAPISNKKRKLPVSVQSSPPPRKKLREDPSLEESSEKGPQSALEHSARRKPRVDKGKAKASVDSNEKAGLSSGAVQSGARAKQAKERQGQSSARKDASEESSSSGTGTLQPPPRPPKPNRRKLAPQRPWPSVPTSSNATGPHSALTEGKNKILVGRKTPLGAYLRRCKGCILADGYKTLYLSATSAAIPTLLIIATSLPEMLPFAKEEIRVEYKTGTVRCMDEILPDEDAEDEEEDPTIQSELVERKIASLSVTLTIGDGKKEVTGKEKKTPKKLRGGGRQNAPKGGQGAKSKTTSQPAMSSDDEMFE
ncbi:hypothetical protein M407DRAFT_86859 [Tulasnella calospora MUT 4182]|uniref:Uncharacterized protein n=1 Tax=Tulasnella calospora MUT 4182 TaxID=1051891 RepID=A0A0C3Q064_9AGAM|nr:hypothetical protein M407DRAFT_86859 [Tulasnella calospora MUT 4182]